MSKNNMKILEVSSSGRADGSVSRTLSQELISELENRHGDVSVSRRDLRHSIPHVDAAWIEANFTPDEDRTATHNEALALSNELVNELKDADIVVIGVAMYNFSIAASLKAWVDMIARARLTFRYTDKGPVGLLEGKKAYLVVATGGVPVGSAVDFATPYLRHALSFIGIDDVEIIAAEKLNVDADEAFDQARARIAELVHLTAAA